MKGYGILSLLSLLSFLSCTHLEEQNNDGDAKSLAEQTMVLYQNYIDSISLAKDSVTYNHLISNFENRITKLNYSFPPNTDLNLTFVDNDSIMKLNERLVKIRREKLNELEKEYGFPQSDSLLINKP